MKKYHFGKRLENREVNLVLRETAIIVETGAVSNQAVFVVLYIRISNFPQEIWQGNSNFIL